MMIRFIHFVEHPHLQTSISSMEIELAALNSKLHSALTKIKDACLEKEQTLNDEVKIYCILLLLNILFVIY